MMLGCDGPMAERKVLGTRLAHFGLNLPVQSDRWRPSASVPKGADARGLSGAL
jgi:hypothetical protein